jgi:hypothetical protein
MLQMARGDDLPILKKVFLTLTLGQHPLKIWVFVANIPGLDICAHMMLSVDLGHHMLRLAEEEYRYGALGQSPGLPAW